MRQRDGTCRVHFAFTHRSDAQKVLHVGCTESVRVSGSAISAERWGTANSGLDLVGQRTAAAGDDAELHGSPDPGEPVSPHYERVVSQQRALWHY